jgi:NADH:ubiquinone oxidoreductase subunit F (NADH-binding)
MQKFRDQKSCSCRWCRDGSKRYEKTVSHKAARKAKKMAIHQFIRYEGDFESGVHGAGYWD